MSERPPRRGFALRPADPEHWIKAADSVTRDANAAGFTARLTIDVTPDLRDRHRPSRSCHPNGRCYFVRYDRATRHRTHLFDHWRFHRRLAHTISH